MVKHTIKKIKKVNIIMVHLGTSYQTVSWVLSIIKIKGILGAFVYQSCLYFCGLGGGWGVRGPKLHKEDENGVRRVDRELQQNTARQQVKQ